MKRRLCITALTQGEHALMCMPALTRKNARDRKRTEMGPTKEKTAHPDNHQRSVAARRNQQLKPGELRSRTRLETRIDGHALV